MTFSRYDCFSGCPIERLYLGRNVCWNDISSPFENKLSLKTLIIGSDVTEIYSNAFMGCRGYDIISYAETPPVLNGEPLEAKSLEVPFLTIRVYAQNDMWKDIESIYSVKDGVKCYPVAIYQDGTKLFAVNDEDYDYIELPENSIVKLTTLTNIDNCYMVLYRGKDITNELKINEEFYFPVSQYTHDNIVKSVAYPLVQISNADGGSLLDAVGMENVDNIYNLKISGEVNGTDILAIRKMLNLRILDLEDANIVDGGLSYYENYTTSANVIGAYFFHDKANLSKVVLPKTITAIGSYAFLGMTNLAYISIPQSVTEVGSNVFYGCNNLEIVILEDGDYTMRFDDEIVFYNCPIRYLHLGRNTRISYYSQTLSFKGLKSLRTVTVGNDVTEIGSDAFRNCYGLTEVSIGEKVSKIGSDAFAGCSSIVSVTSLNTTPPEITSTTFDEITEENATLHVPEGCKAIYWLHPYWEKFLDIKADVIDGIESVVNDKDERMENNAIYTIGGVKYNTTNLSELPKGIYILNGKKYIVK